MQTNNIPSTITIIAEDLNDLELLVNKVKHVSAEVGLELNQATTKVP